ncbi:MAG: PD40 domain-containing protein [Rubrobacter sp.]|jgi:TolB protein|nr:PD40 domain-containing protein [Rubrobacter sp.]
MQFRKLSKPALAAMLAAFLAVLLGGCAASGEVSISPLPSGERGSELGAGVRPLSHGPGYKGSPAWSLDGERISFTIDGYVVDKPLRGRDTRRWTARDFGAREIEANTGRSMLILGEDDESGGSGSLYRSLPSEDSTEVSEVAPGILTAEQVGEGGAIIAALESGEDESSLLLVRGDEVERTFGDAVEGSVAGISLSPNGRRLAISVAPPGEDAASEIRIFELSDGSESELVSLEEGRQVFGAPQWTEAGIYFVSGTEDGSGGSSSLYRLYRVPNGSGEPESAPGIGSDFAASGIKLSPDGSKLAIIGRLHANSPTNLHILDLAADTLSAATSSEDMDIRNNPRDMSWSPDGESVAIVARSSFSSPRVRSAPADGLLEEFYNLYEVPVGE